MLKQNKNIFKIPNITDHFVFQSNFEILIMPYKNFWLKL